MKNCALLDDEATTTTPNPALAEFATLLGATLLRSSQIRGELDAARRDESAIVDDEETELAERR